MRRTLALLTAFILSGCARATGPPSTDTSSDALPSLERRIEFLEQYVAFRRNYKDLTFHIRFSNNSGGLVPGPTEWDIRLVAAVPPAELDAWVPHTAVKTSAAATPWPSKVPGNERAAAIHEWYIQNPGLEVGIDREHSVVAYHAWAY